VGWSSRSVVSDDGVFAECDADSGDLGLSAEACQERYTTHSFGDILHVPHYEVVALGVVEDGEAPWVFEGDEVRLLGVEVEVHCAEAPNLLARHLRPVYALLEVWWEQRCPYQKEAAVSALVELGHHAVDNVWLGRDDVHGVHVADRLPPVLDALDVCEVRIWRLGSVRSRVLVMLRLRMSSSLTTLLMSFWLSSSTMSIFHCAVAVSGVRAHWGELHTSPRVVCLIELRMTRWPISTCSSGVSRCVFTVALDIDHGSHVGGVSQRMPLRKGDAVEAAAVT